MPKDAVKEGSYRLGALVQIYVGPKMFQALEGTFRTLAEPDARLSNEALVILEKALPGLGIKTRLPPITTEPASLDTLEKGSLRGIAGLVTKMEAGLADIQGQGPATAAFRFTRGAVYYMQVRKFVPHHAHEIQQAREALAGYTPLLGIGESQLQEFMADPKDRWGSTFDLVVAPQRRTLIERLQPKVPKYPLDGGAADELIRKWLGSW